MLGCACARNAFIRIYSDQVSPEKLDFFFKLQNPNFEINQIVESSSNIFHTVSIFWPSLLSTIRIIIHSGSQIGTTTIIIPWWLANKWSGCRITMVWLWWCCCRSRPLIGTEMNFGKICQLGHHKYIYVFTSSHTCSNRNDSLRNHHDSFAVIHHR